MVALPIFGTSARKSCKPLRTSCAFFPTFTDSCIGIMPSSPLYLLLCLSHDTDNYMCQYFFCTLGRHTTSSERKNARYCYLPNTWLAYFVANVDFHNYHSFRDNQSNNTVQILNYAHTLLAHYIHNCIGFMPSPAHPCR